MKDFEIRLLAATTRLKKALTSQSFASAKTNAQAQHDFEQYLAEQGQKGYSVTERSQRVYGPPSVQAAFVPTPVNDYSVCKALHPCMSCGRLSTNETTCVSCANKLRFAGDE